MSSNGSVHDPKYFAHDRRAAGEQESQRVRKAQYPLAHRLFGKDPVHQQCRILGFGFLRRSTFCIIPAVVGHAPSTTTGAKTAPFTAERHKALGVTSFAPHAQKSVFKAAAFEVLIELALGIPRQ